jgi:hypothetical protein
MPPIEELGLKCVRRDEIQRPGMIHNVELVELDKPKKT